MSLAGAWIYFLLCSGVVASKVYNKHKVNRNVRNGNIYLFSAGYDPALQSKLELSTHAELVEQLGREFDHTDKARLDAIKEILSKKHRRYLDIEEVRRTNPNYRMAAGLPTRPGDVTYEEYLKEHPRPPVSPARAREIKRDNIRIASVLVSIVLVPILIWLVIQSWPPLPDAYIGMSYSSWSKKHTYQSKGWQSSKRFYVCQETRFGANAKVLYRFNNKDKLEYIELDYSESYFPTHEIEKKFGRAEQENRYRLLYRQGLNYEVLVRSETIDDEWYGDRLIIQKRGARYKG